MKLDEVHLLQKCCDHHVTEGGDLKGGFLFCGSRKLTYFHSGKRKYSVHFTAFGHENSDGRKYHISEV